MKILVDENLMVNIAEFIGNLFDDIQDIEDGTNEFLDNNIDFGLLEELNGFLGELLG